MLFAIAMPNDTRAHQHGRDTGTRFGRRRPSPTGLALGALALALFDERYTRADSAAPSAAVPAEVSGAPMFFVEAQAGAWLGWVGSFGENHKSALAVDLVGGMSLERWTGRARVDLLAGLTVTSHELQPRAFVGDQTSTVMAAGYLI